MKEMKWIEDFPYQIQIVGINAFKNQENACYNTTNIIFSRHTAVLIR